MSLRLEAIRDCFEGAIPGAMGTADPQGTPNISYLSQVHLVDAGHVALSYQFFSKTRQNLQTNPNATLCVIHPLTAAQYRLKLVYLRTETSGPLFESMKAKLAGIASHVGMGGVFKLLGADVFAVTALEQVPGSGSLPAPPPRRNLLAALRQASERLRSNCELDAGLTATMASLAEDFGIEQAMALLYDERGARLYTVASHGYPESGIGSEIALGSGVIGVAARERTPIRISHMTAEYNYGRAIRDNSVDTALIGAPKLEIPLPGLPESRSQLAVPLLAGTRLLGVLYVESPVELRFSYDDEDAIVSLANALAMLILVSESLADLADDAPPALIAARSAVGEPLLVRHFPANDSVFLGDDYLIKGVAGSILATMVADYVEKGRTEFTNRELRLDARIRLPDISDNLEGRLLLLVRRLAEREAGLRIERTGRGRLKLCADRPLKLVCCDDQN